MFTTKKLTGLATLLALCVIVLGAWVRLTDAGLGCPDWPGCYGHLGVPEHATEVAAANSAFPDRPVETDKAWKEMIHRYFAGVLVLLSLLIAYVTWRGRALQRVDSNIALGGVALIFAQAIMGMLTVIWLVNPLIVTGHLIMGLSMAALFWYLHLRQYRFSSATSSLGLRLVTLFGLVVLVCQILLGGWTSTNYAALACTDFPSCHGSYWPDMDAKEAFTLWRGLGVDYEGGVLENRARVTIHFAHRIGAIVAAVVLLLVALVTMKNGGAAQRRVAVLLKLLLVTQIALGILNVVAKLPLGVAVAHNGVAALLLLTLITLNYMVWSSQTRTAATQ